MPRLNLGGHRAYTYKVLVAPAELPVSLDTFKLHIKRKTSIEDSLLTIYLNAAIEYAEIFTRRCLINRTFRTFRDFFPHPYQNEGYYSFGVIPPGYGNYIQTTNINVGFELRKSPLVSVEAIQYWPEGGGGLVTVNSGVYYNTEEEDYSEVLNNTNQEWPTNVLQRLQAVRIDFICGMGANESQIAACWKDAILAHATNLWANRGDCGGCPTGSVVKSAVPPSSHDFYLTKRIHNL